jgi:hypothetical protein
MVCAQNSRTRNSAIPLLECSYLIRCREFPASCSLVCVSEATARRDDVANRKAAPGLARADGIIVLQPLPIQGQLGVNIAAGVSRLELRFTR